MGGDFVQAFQQSDITGINSSVTKDALRLRVLST